MSFQSISFFLFAAIFWVALVLAGPRLNFKKNILLLASYYFYMSWDMRFAAVLLLLTGINFWAGSGIAAAAGPRRRKLVFAAAIGASLSVLAYFKYANFFVDELAALLRGLGLMGEHELLKIVLPIGISFYTFQSLSYVFDVYRGKIPPTASIRDFALFVSFFPTVLSGPISRASTLLPQIEKGGAINASRCDEGLLLVVRGCLKKVLFADTLAMHIVNPAFADPHTQSTWFLIVAVYAYSFQIYMDLSGYTDMARGVAKIFGFDLAENFNIPYAARTVSEFWQRWHMSMSGFFRDYLYHSIGGSKYGNVYLNLIITFVAIGIWHGAGWNFVLYGLIHGLFVGWERFVRKPAGATSAPGRLNVIWKIVFIFSVVSFSRILFRADDLSSAANFVRAMVDGFGQASTWSTVGLGALGVAVLLHLVPERSERKMQAFVQALPWPLKAVALITVFYLLLALQQGSGGFIYFKF
jgi:alginate O-acetyltransferase complex protein AlgI